MKREISKRYPKCFPQFTGISSMYWPEQWILKNLNVVVATIAWLMLSAESALSTNKHEME